MVVQAIPVARQDEFYAEQSTVVIGLITGLGTLIAAMMGIGAIFGALNGMAPLPVEQLYRLEARDGIMDLALLLYQAYRERKDMTEIASYGPATGRY